jgi:hypothetical protein
MKPVHGWLMALTLLAATSPAQAAFGNGIRVGGAEGRLHPFLDLELRYDSNVAVSYDPVGRTSGDLAIHVRPGLQLTVPGDMLAVDLRAALDWAQYLGLKDTLTRDLSGLYATASLGIGFNRRGQLGLELDEKFARSNTPSAYSVAAGVLSNFNTVSLRAPWRPGGGALTLSVAGDWTIESFEAYKSGQVCSTISSNPFCNPAYLADLGYNNLGAAFGVNWRFLPKTAALLDVSWFDRISSSTRYSVSGSGVRASLGATGLVTSHLAATVKAGYATTLGLSLDPALAAGTDLATFRTWLATVSVEWLPTTASSVKLSANHDLGFDPGTTWSLYGITRLGLEGKSRFGGLYTASLSVDWAKLTYRDAAATTSNVLTLKPSLKADLARWLLLELSYQYTNRTTDLALAGRPPGWQYSRNEIWLRSMVTY